MAGIKAEKSRVNYDVYEGNINYDRITGEIEFGIFEVDGTKYTISSITVGVDASKHLIDFGTKRLSFEPVMTFEDLQGFGVYEEGIAVSGGGLVFNKDGELVATYFGMRSNVTVGAGLSWTRIKEIVEDEEVPVGTVSSVRLPGQLGTIKIGDEINVLDYLSHKDNRSVDSKTDCFLGHTLIDMWPVDEAGFEPGPDGTFDQERVRAALWQKPIREITPGDWVVSFENGMMVPGKVTRVFENESRIILDFHGTYVTPGHVYYCAGGTFEGRYVPLIDILRDDGAVKRADGSLMRASTGCDVGCEDDTAFWAYKLYTDVDGKERARYRKQLRLGTRFLMPDGHVSTISAYLRSKDMELIRKGPYEAFVKHRKTGLVRVFVWMPSATIPNPEDFVPGQSRTGFHGIDLPGGRSAGSVPFRFHRNMILVGGAARVIQRQPGLERRDPARCAGSRDFTRRTAVERRGYGRR